MDLSAPFHLRRTKTARSILSIAFVFSLVGIGTADGAAIANLPLVPWPQEVHLDGGAMAITAKNRIRVKDAELLPLAKILSKELATICGFTLCVDQGIGTAGDIQLLYEDALKKEHYRMVVADRATIVGGDYNAVAMGTATLLQALRTSESGTSLPKLTLKDHPFFEYRGAMFDIARCPYSIETLRQIVQVCRLYKIRHVHLHMTDDNAFLFPSTAFPQLGAVNAGSFGGPPPTRYKLEELKELVAYADARGVTLVPELELPGHCGSLVGGMPEVFAGYDESGQQIGLGMINVGNEKTYEVLDTLIGEICDVFRSSPYLHTGGDEVVMVNLEKCPQIMNFAKAHKLESPYYAINPFQHRLHALVTKRGKQMIVWDGAHHPKPLPKDVITMPWQLNTPVAAELVGKGYRVINAPWGTREPYFDPYLCNGAQLRHGEPLLIGATSILWEAVETKAIPYLRDQGSIRIDRMHNPNSGRTHYDFVQRVSKTDLLVDQLVNGFTLDVSGLVPPTVYMRLNHAFTDKAKIVARNRLADSQIRYTVDGSDPTADSPRLERPLELMETTVVQARAFDPSSNAMSPILTQQFTRVPTIKHDAIGARVTYKPDYPGYLGPGAAGLVDGYLSEGDDYAAAGWVGWLNSDLEIDIDLGKSIPIERIGGRFARGRFGLNLPKRVEFLVSSDGQTFQSIANIDDKAAGRERGWYSATVNAVSARYIRVSTKSGGDWTFVDEIAINYEPLAPLLKHAAIGKKVTMVPQLSPPYNLPGIEGLTDGYIARSNDFATPYWIGIEGRDIEATLDLGEVTDIRNVGVHVLRFVPAGIYFPRAIEVHLSKDGKTFEAVGNLLIPNEDRAEAMARLSMELDGARGRYVRFICRQQTFWTFLDELFVNQDQPQ